MWILNKKNMKKFIFVRKFSISSIFLRLNVKSFTFESFRVFNSIMSDLRLKKLHYRDENQEKLHRMLD